MCGLFIYSDSVFNTARKMSKYGVFSGPYFPAFGLQYLSVFTPNAGKYGPEKNSVFGHFSRIVMSLSTILPGAKFWIRCSDLNTILYFRIKLIYVNHFWLYNNFMKLCGDFEEKLVLKPSSNQVFSICHWNLNSISVHYIKLSILRPYLSTHKFDVICISETFLDSNTSYEDAYLEKVGY